MQMVGERKTCIHTNTNADSINAHLFIFSLTPVCVCVCHCLSLHPLIPNTHTENSRDLTGCDIIMILYVWCCCILLIRGSYMHTYTKCIKAHMRFSYYIRDWGAPFELSAPVTLPYAQFLRISLNFLCNGDNC